MYKNMAYVCTKKGYEKVEIVGVGSYNKSGSMSLMGGVEFLCKYEDGAFQTFKEDSNEIYFEKSEIEKYGIEL